MMTHGFDMYRVIISTPGDLLREQDACRAAISEVNEKEAMPQKILLVSVGLREDARSKAFDRQSQKTSGRVLTTFRFSRRLGA